MSVTPVILERLRGVQRTGEGWLAFCPAHEDHEHRSLHISQTPDKTLLKCFVGCTTEQITHAAGTTLAALFTANASPSPSSSATRNGGRSALTLQAFAEAKGLPADFLRTHGVVEDARGLRITYRLADGTEAPRQRRRTALVAKDGSSWDGPRGEPPVAYGLWRLDDALDLGELLLVEGETDTQTGWLHNVAVLGIPGADMLKVLEADALRDIARLWILQEPDLGGSTFVAGCAKRLAQLGFEGEAYVVRLPTKDLNDLHRLAGNGFAEALARAQAEAIPLGSAAAARYETGAEEAPHASPTRDVPTGKVLAGPEIFALPISGPDWVVEGLFSRGHQHMVVAASQGAKSWLLADLAVAVTHSECTHVLGQPVCVHGPVDIESWEMGQAEDVRRLQKVFRGRGLSYASEDLRLVSDPPTTLRDESYFSRRLRELQERKVLFYLVDSLSEAAGIELNDNTAYTEFWRTRVKPLLDLGITVVFTHLRGHAKPGVAQDRDSASRGATQIRALSTHVLELRQLADTLFAVKHNKHRNSTALTFGPLELEGRSEDDWIRLTLRDDMGAGGKEALALELLTKLGRESAQAGTRLTRKGIEARLNDSDKPKAERVSKKVYEAVLGQMVADGLVISGKQGNAETWTWVSAVEDESAESPW